MLQGFSLLLTDLSKRMYWKGDVFFVDYSELQTHADIMIVSKKSFAILHSAGRRISWIADITNSNITYRILSEMSDQLRTHGDIRVDKRAMVTNHGSILKDSIVKAFAEKNALFGKEDDMRFFKTMAEAEAYVTDQKESS